MGEWCVIGKSELIKPCPFCGSEAVMIASPTRFGIQCDNLKCLALVYTNYSAIIYQSHVVENRKITDEEFEQIAHRTAKKWNRRLNDEQV